jgi:hypothetical protein
VVASAVALLAIVAFAPALFGGWIFDDHSLIAQNPYAHSFQYAPRWFTHDFWDINPDSVHLATRLTYWRPLVNASYCVDWNLGNGSPVMFHITNALLHAAVAVLAFTTLRRWTRALLPAALAAALFVAHPTKAENVAWIAGRTDIVCTLAILVVLAGMARRMDGKRGGIALEILGTVGAYLSKEQAIVLPAFVLVELWVAWDRPPIDLAFVRRSIRPMAPQVVIAFAYLVVRALVLPLRNFAMPSRSLVDHALALLDSLGRFVAELFVPSETVVKVALIHAGGHTGWFVALGVLASTALVAAALGFRTRAPAVTLACIAFAVAIAPTVEMASTGFSPLLMERFLYLPTLALALLVAVLLAGANLSVARIGSVVALLAIVVTTYLATQRSSLYSDETVFADHEVELHGDNYDVRRFRVDIELRAHRSRRALADLIYLRQFAKRTFLVDSAYEIADIATGVVPDLDKESLGALDTFVGHLIDRDVSRATLRIPPVTLETEVFAPSPHLKPRMYALRANIASRLGETDRALALIAEADKACDACAAIATIHALILARAGRLDEAVAALDKSGLGSDQERVAGTLAHIRSAGEHLNRASALSGPDRLREQHEAFAALGMWGKAYELVAPYRAAFASSPELDLVYAGTAVRAGRPDEARAVLAAHHSPDEIDAFVAAAMEDMGWGP